LGGHRKITVDVRVVAATNQDLNWPCRKADSARIFIIASVNSNCACRRCASVRRYPGAGASFSFLKAADKVFTADALVTLHGHPWPGKYSELRNLVASWPLLQESGRSRVLKLLPNSAAKFSRGEDVAGRRGSGAVRSANLTTWKSR